MTTPCIITVAITGSLPQKSDNPAVPISIAEQIESTHEAFEAGATLVHAHVRKDDGSPTSDPERFGRLVEGLKKHCPGIIIQLSTGGRSGSGRERGGMIPLRPDMCSLSTGSCNFPTPEPSVQASKLSFCGVNSSTVPGMGGWEMAVS